MFGTVPAVVAGAGTSREEVCWELGRSEQARRGARSIAIALISFLHFLAIFTFLVFLRNETVDGKESFWRALLCLFSNFDLQHNSLFSFEDFTFQTENNFCITAFISLYVTASLSEILPRTQSAFSDTRSVKQNKT